MRHSLVYFSFILFLQVLFGVVQAVELNGLTTPVYKTTHHVFHDRDTVQGFVDLCKGFTVVPVASGAQSTHGANLFMDTNVTVSGAIDLRGTNTLTLLRDLYLDEGVSFSDSGRIYSYGNALVMRGDLTIPADKVLHCGGNLIIDGNGNTLHLGSSSQIFLDNSSTLTLRNMIIETAHTYPGQPALNISSNMSKLALDNVILSLGDDLHIPRGQLFFHNDVVVTGTSALVYRSAVPSYIASHGTLMFDHGTTFSFAPAANNKDLFVLSDKSATLAFNDASLLATHTGLRLTKGRLYFDNKVVLDGVKDTIINSTTPINTSDYNATTGNTPQMCSWSFDSKYVAVANYGGHTLQVFAFTGSVLTQAGSDASISGPLACSWSPDDKYIAVVSDASDTLQIFAFSDGVLNTTPVSSVGIGTHPHSCMWSSDGRYIAVSGRSDNTLRVYAFSEETPVLVGNVGTGSAEPFFAAWSPDGKYIAVVNWTGHTLQVYSFSGGTPLLVGGSFDTGVDSQPFYCSWSPDGKNIAVANFGFKELQVFSFSGSTPSLIDGISTGFGVGCLCWAPDGKYINTTGSDKLQIFSFSGEMLAQVGGDVTVSGYYVTAGLWSYDGNYIAVTSHENLSPHKLKIYRVNRLVDTSVPTLSNCITFGNSSLGPTYDLDVHVLSGARVEVTGSVFHDPA